MYQGRYILNKNKKDSKKGNVFKLKKSSWQWKTLQALEKYNMQVYNYGKKIFWYKRKIEVEKNICKKNQETSRRKCTHRKHAVE